MMKKKLLATLLTLSMTATTLAGATVVSAAEEHEPVELTIWVTSRNQDDWYLSMEEKFLEEHPWITLNKVVKEGDPGNEFYQGVASGTAPDLVNCSFTMMDSYIAAGILEPLNAYTDSWDEWGSFTKEYVDMFTKDDNIYGIPSTVAPMLFGYNNGSLCRGRSGSCSKNMGRGTGFCKENQHPAIRLPDMPLWLLNGLNGSSSIMYGRQAAI